MGRLSDLFDNIKKKWGELNSKKRIGIAVLISGIIVSGVFLVSYMSKPKYGALFVDMQTEDQAQVVSLLKKDKVSYKLNGSSILVPKDKIDELRLEVLSSGTLPSDGKGFEIFDQSNFGMTDTQTQILYQSALETELQRTIKTLDEIDDVRVHLVLPESSAFVSDEQPAKASVTLKLKNNEKLSSQQVKAIIALVSGSVKDLDPKDVQVVDSNYNYLSENLYANNTSSTTDAQNNYEMKTKFENDLSDGIKKMLEAVYGPDKVIVKVNADLDFNSTETTSIKYDAQGIIASQNKIIQNNSGTASTTSGSPTTQNQATSPSYTIPSGSSNNGSTNSQETTNYDVGHVDQKIISAPGQVKMLSTSVIIDKNLTDAEKQSIENIVKGATGFVNDQNRQDQIAVEGMAFDTTMKQKVDADIKAMEQQQAQAKRNKNLIILGLIGAAVIAIVIFIIVTLKRRSKNDEEMEEGLGVPLETPIPLQVAMKNNPPIETPVEKENIEEVAATIADVEEEKKPDIQDEVKEYASKKPDQIAEIVKTWLADDERF